MHRLTVNDKTAARTGSPVPIEVDEAPEKVFDDLTWLAAQICCAPMAAVSFRGPRGQWLKSKVGLTNGDGIRDLALFEETLKSRGLKVVSDALLDPRLARDPLVTTTPKLRFFAGVPLITSDGNPVGTLSVMDRVPRELSQEQIYALEVLARQVVSQLELRRRVDNHRTRSDRE